MNAVVESVRSLWVPLNGVNLLVPNVAIAEVINYQPLDLIQDGPEFGNIYGLVIPGAAG